MELADVLEGIGDVRITGHADPDIRSVACDSRKVAAGALFFALPGAKTDGNEFVKHAIERGAIAIAAGKARPAETDPRITWIELPAGAARLFLSERKSGSWSGDDVAVRPSRHQAILHLAGRRQIVSQPQSERQDRNRDRQPGDRSTAVSALFGIGHLSVSPGNG